MNKNILTNFLIPALVLILSGSTPPDGGSGDSNDVADHSAFQDKYLDPGMQKIIQVAIVVKDIETSSRKWAEILGMPVPEIRTTRPGNEVDVIYRGQPSDGQVKLTFFNLGQVVLELLEPVSAGTSWWEFMQTQGEGVQHIGFKVVDKDKTSEELIKAGYPIFHQGRYDSDDGTYIYFDTQDALGVVVELLHSDPK